jgi:hypothetical protein
MLSYYLLVPTQTTVLDPTDSNKYSHNAACRPPPACYRPRLGWVAVPDFVNWVRQLVQSSSVVSQVAGSRLAGRFNGRVPSSCGSSWRSRIPHRYSLLLLSLHGIRLLWATKPPPFTVLRSRNGRRLWYISRHLDSSHRGTPMSLTEKAGVGWVPSPVISLHGFACHDIRTCYY